MKRFVILLLTVLLVFSVTTPVLAYPDWIHGWTKIEYTIEGSVSYGHVIVNISGYLRYKVLQDTTDNVYVERELNITYSPENITEFIQFGFYSYDLSIWINKFTREYMVGREVYKTDLWIEHGLKKGDKTIIWNKEFEVKVDNIIYRTNASGFERRGSLELVFSEEIGEEIIKITAYYDKDITLLLGMKVELLGRGYFEIRLSNTNIGKYETIFWYLVTAWIVIFSIGLVVYAIRSVNRKK